MELRAGYKQTDVGRIPQEWELKSLGKFIALQRGHDLTERQRRRGNVPVMGSAGQNGFHDIARAQGPGVTLGRSGASFGQAHYCGSDFWPHNTALYVTDFFGNLPLFVFYFLKSIDFSHHNSGGAQQSLNRNFIAPIQVAVPQRSEQEVITAALSDVDALIASLDALIAKKRDIKQAAMQQLLTGKTRLPGFRGEWIPRLFGDAFIFLRNGSNSRSDLSDDGDVGYIHYGDIHRSHSAFLDCSSSSMTRIAGDKVSKLPRVRDGDLVIADASEDYDGVGKSVEVEGIGDGEVVAGLHTILLRSKPEFISDGFKGYLQFIPALKSELIRIASGISVYGISKANVKAISVLLPPPNEQAAIVGILSDGDAEITTLEAKRDKVRALKQGMMQELLTGKIRLV